MGRPHEDRRGSPRLPDYDYRDGGAYFVTLCVQDRLALFGAIRSRTMRLSRVGRMVAAAWVEMPQRFPAVSLDEFIVMPDHLHGIVLLSNPCAPAPADPDGPRLGDVIGAFKSITTGAYCRGVARDGWARFQRRLWQRNYYDHVVRGPESLHRIREYIRTNPARRDRRTLQDRWTRPARWHFDAGRPRGPPHRFDAPPRRSVVVNAPHHVGAPLVGARGAGGGRGPGGIPMQDGHKGRPYRFDAPPRR